ncbi:MAG: MATE family efflux transporter, partial [Clostridia bacterium]|nr:MATE family efflux transporter [Clostridia bacterium]
MTQTKTLRQKFIGDKTFYKMVLAVAVPIVIQNGITNLVNVLDNVMVGQLGTESMSGVAIANQLIFVFNLCIFGGLSGPGIFGAQYHGSGNADGVRQTFRFKLYIVAGLSAIFMTAFITKNAELLSLYLHQSESGGDLALTLSEGQLYLRIMLLGLIPFALNNAYIGTLRETGETLLPMKAGVTAVLVNLVFNWLLIFGHCGFPELGVAGAAIATVLSRYVELAIVVIWTHAHKEKNKFIVGAYKSLWISKEVAYRIIRKGWPLLLNEVLWSIGITSINQCYSTRGLAAVAAVNIAATLGNLFKIVMMASGNAIAILVGQRLGAGRMEEARDIDNKLIFATCS